MHGKCRIYFERINCVRPRNKNLHGEREIIKKEQTGAVLSFGRINCNFKSFECLCAYSLCRTFIYFMNPNTRVTKFRANNSEKNLTVNHNRVSVNDSLNRLGIRLFEVLSELFVRDFAVLVNPVQGVVAVRENEGFRSIRGRPNDLNAPRRRICTTNIVTADRGKLLTGIF